MVELDRCPQCGASVPAGASWCSLCYASLDAGPDPVTPETGPAVADGSFVPPRSPDPGEAPPAGSGSRHAARGRSRSGRHAAAPAPARPPADPAAQPDPVQMPPPTARTDAPDGPRPRRPLGEQELPAGVDAMLAELAAHEAAAKPVVVDRFESKGLRIGVMLGGTVVLSVVIVLVAWIVGLLM